MLFHHWYQQKQNQAQFAIEITMQKQGMRAAKNLCSPSWKIFSWLLDAFAVVTTFPHEKEKS